MNEKKPQKVHTLFHSGICKILDDLLQVFTTGLKTVTKPTRNKKRGFTQKKAVRSPCFLITIHRLISSNHPRKKILIPLHWVFWGWNLCCLKSEVYTKLEKMRFFITCCLSIELELEFQAQWVAFLDDNNIMTISSPLYNFRFWSVTRREIELDWNLRAHKSVSKNSFQICLKLENPHDDV